jgi:hypothetical protein
MRSRHIKALGAAAWGVGVLIGAAPAQAAEESGPRFFALSSGWFDVGREGTDSMELHLEYHSNSKLWIFKPFGGVMGISNGASYLYAGLRVEVPLGRRFMVTPSIAPGWYNRGAGFDLGYPLEFRSQLELALRFGNQARLGIAVSHMSNAGLGHINPGIESLTLNYSMPLASK